MPVFGGSQSRYTPLAVSSPVRFMGGPIDCGTGVVVVEVVVGGAVVVVVLVVVVVVLVVLVVLVVVVLEVLSDRSVISSHVLPSVYGE